MDFKFLELLGVDGYWVALILAILAFFWKGDEALSNQFRTDLSAVINGTRVPAERQVWLGHVQKISDALLGRGTFELRHTLRLFLLGSAAYLLTVLVILQSNGALSLRTLVVALTMYLFAGVPSILGMASIIVMLIKIFLEQVYRGGNAFAYALLGLGAAWTVMQVLQLVFILLFAGSYFVLGVPSEDTARSFADYTLSEFSWNGVRILDMSEERFLTLTTIVFGAPILALCILPSAIIVLSALGLLLARWASGMNRTLSVFSYVLPVDEKPVRSIGIVVALAMAAVLAATSALSWSWRLLA
jgi:hypothetical protein